MAESTTSSVLHEEPRGLQADDQVLAGDDVGLALADPGAVAHAPDLDPPGGEVLGHVQGRPRRCRWPRWSGCRPTGPYRRTWCGAWAGPAVRLPGPRAGGRPFAGLRSRPCRARRPARRPPSARPPAPTRRPWPSAPLASIRRLRYMPPPWPPNSPRMSSPPGLSPSMPPSSLPSRPGLRRPRCGRRRPGRPCPARWAAPGSGTAAQVGFASAGCAAAAISRRTP